MKYPIYLHLLNESNIWTDTLTRTLVRNTKHQSVDCRTWYSALSGRNASNLLLCGQRHHFCSILIDNFLLSVSIKIKRLIQALWMSLFVKPLLLATKSTATFYAKQDFGFSLEFLLLDPSYFVPSSSERRQEVTILLQFDMSALPPSSSPAPHRETGDKLLGFVLKIIFVKQ